MAKQSQKSPAVKCLLDTLAKNAFGRTRSAAITSNACVICGKQAVRFKDELSRREYAISGMCQECQDKTFQ